MPVPLARTPALTRPPQDYCGVLTEESIRKNFVLVYELLDEMLDFGLAQGTSTEVLKAYVHNEPVQVVSTSATQQLKMGGSSAKTTPSSAVHKPIAVGTTRKTKGQKNEIFVDILERLSLTFNSNVRCCPARSPQAAGGLSPPAPRPPSP